MHMKSAKWTCTTPRFLAQGDPRAAGVTGRSSGRCSVRQSAGSHATETQGSSAPDCGAPQDRRCPGRIDLQLTPPCRNRRMFDPCLITAPTSALGWIGWILSELMHDVDEQQSYIAKKDLDEFQNIIQFRRFQIHWSKRTIDVLREVNDDLGLNLNLPQIFEDGSDNRGKGIIRFA